MDEVKRGNEGKSREVTGLPETEVGKDSPTHSCQATTVYAQG